MCVIFWFLCNNPICLPEMIGEYIGLHDIEHIVFSLFLQILEIIFDKKGL